MTKDEALDKIFALIHRDIYTGEKLSRQSIEVLYFAAGVVSSIYEAPATVLKEKKDILQPTVWYLCDHSACNDVDICPASDCHTSDIEHARNFYLRDNDFWEKTEKDDEHIRSKEAGK